jgi:hypothetical protein
VAGFHFPFKLLWIPVAFSALACRPSEPTLSYAQQFEHEDPTVRVQAIVRAGRQEDSRAYVYLIDALSDPQPAVRFYASIALEKMTGLTMDYRYYDPWPRRQDAVERWRRWLASRGGPAEAPPPNPTKPDRGTDGRE